MPQRPTTSSTDDVTAGEGKSSRARSRLLPALIVAIGLIGAAKVTGIGGAPEANGTVPPVTTTVEELHPVALEPMTLNLADGRFLKIQLGLGLREAEAEPEEGKDEDPRARWAKALDQTVSVFGQMTYGELITPEGRAGAKDILSRQLSELYDGQIGEVYYLEFVMQ